MPSFSDLKNAYRLQKEAKRVKKELRLIHIEAEAQGVKVVVTAEQEVESIVISPEVPREQIPLLLKDAMNRAMKKAQVVSAERMQGVMKEMGVPGAS